MQKLGEFLASMSISQDEKGRLADRFTQKDSLPYTILSSKIHTINDQNFWSNVHKTLKLTGFRIGRAKDHALILALNTKDPLNDSKESRVLWRLYRRCAVTYIVDDLKNLNRLLLDEYIENISEEETEKLFKIMVSLKDAYDVPIDEFEEFYEIWPFTRIDNLDKILDSCEISITTVTRMIEKQLDKFKSEINDFSSKEDLENQISSLKGDFERELSRVNKNNSNRIEDIKMKISSVRTEFQNSIALSVSKAHVPEEITKSLSILKDKIEDQETTISTDSFNVLQDRIENLEKSIDELEEKTNEIVKSGYRTSIHKINTETNKAATLGQIINDISRKLRSLNFANADFLNLASMFCLLRATRTIVTESNDLVNLIVQNLPWNLNKITIAAHPIVKSMNDIMTSDQRSMLSSNQPTALIVQDFDVGVQEVYLVPELLSLRGKAQSNLIFVFLIPSESNLNSTSPRILELAPFVDQIFEQQHKNYVIQKKVFSGLAHEFLASNPGSDHKKQKDLSDLSQNMGLNIPPQVGDTFGRCYSSLQQIMRHHDAMDLALKMTIMPWLELKKGLPFRRTLEERISPLIREFY